MFECFVRSLRLFVCQSLHTLKTTCEDVGFHFNFGWDMDWCLDLCYFFGGVGLGGGVLLSSNFIFGWGCFSLEYLGDKFYLSCFFYFLFNFFFFNFLKIKNFFFFCYFFFTVLWWNLINICSTFTHSLTQFFLCIGGSVSVGRCAYFVLGQQQLNNCFWKIWVALRRARFGATCAG